MVRGDRLLPVTVDGLSGCFGVTDFADLTAVDPPAPRLPLLSLEEAQDVVEVLAAVVAGADPDVDLARHLLSNLGSRVPSRDEEVEPAAGPRRVSARGMEIARALGEPPRRPLRNPDRR
jgi:hypothetical protein